MDLVVLQKWDGREAQACKNTKQPDKRGGLRFSWWLPLKERVESAGHEKEDATRDSSERAAHFVVVVGLCRLPQVLFFSYTVCKFARPSSTNYSCPKGFEFELRLTS